MTIVVFDDGALRESNLVNALTGDGICFAACHEHGLADNGLRDCFPWNATLCMRVKSLFVRLFFVFCLACSFSNVH